MMYSPQLTVRSEIQAVFDITDEWTHYQDELLELTKQQQRLETITQSNDAIAQILEPLTGPLKGRIEHLETALERATKLAQPSGTRRSLEAAKAAHDTFVYETQLAKLKAENKQPAQERAANPPGTNGEALSERRDALLRSYLSAFKEKIYKIDFCWAANQRYRELARWLSGALKNDSAADKAFMAVLNSGKTPKELRSELRPKDWK